MTRYIQIISSEGKTTGYRQVPDNYEPAAENEYLATREEYEKYRKAHESSDMNKTTALGLAEGQRLIDHTKDLAGFLPIADKPVNWVVKDVIAKPSLTIIGGAPATYKSTLTQYLALCVADGHDWLAYYNTQKQNVIYIDSENSDFLAARRFKQLLRGHELEPPRNLYVVPVTNLKLNKVEGEIALTRLIKHCDAGVVILDSMRRFMEGGEDNADDVSLVFDTLKGVMDATGVAIIVLHHLRKSRNGRPDLNDLRGSGDFGAMTDFAYMLSKSDNASNIFFSTQKHRYRPESDMQPFTMGVRNPYGVDESIMFEHLGVVEGTKTVGEECADLLEDWIRGNGITDFRTKDAINYLKSKGKNENGWREGAAESEKRFLFRNVAHGRYKVCKPQNQEEVKL